MKQNNKFRELFPTKPIIGMIHLAGRDQNEKVYRALEELQIYSEEGIAGAIVEDYHGRPEDVEETLRHARDIKITLGVNILRDPGSGFRLADRYGAKFVQFDSVGIRGQDLIEYNEMRRNFPNIVVLGGVEFKYTTPTGNSLEQDLEEAMSRCEAIVTTGPETGTETPIEKLRNYRRLLGTFPLIVGAGVKKTNIREQLAICDGAIIGSYFKPASANSPNGDTQLPVQRSKVRSLMNLVRGI